MVLDDRMDASKAKKEAPEKETVSDVCECRHLVNPHFSCFASVMTIDFPCQGFFHYRLCGRPCETALSGAIPRPHIRFAYSWRYGK
jgi:hypothetical protein